MDATLETRIARELQQIQDEKDGISKSTGGLVQILQKSLLEFEVVMQGPTNTPYAEGIFTVSIQLSDDYPFVGPTMNFVTPIWHPNVAFESGEIGLDFLDDQWSPAWSLQSMVLVVWSLLQTPALDGCCMNQQAADDCYDNATGFINMAQFYTRLHAGTETEEEIQNKQVDRMAQMGFDSVSARQVLKLCDWNEDDAVTELLNMGALAVEGETHDVDDQSCSSSDSGGDCASSCAIKQPTTTASSENGSEDSSSESNSESSAWSMVEGSRVAETSSPQFDDVESGWVNVW